uniref:Uncharacterized protein n=1 Tax=Mesocestoides corti TaxID=53468 RepID=A0A5K3F9K4_MESCO
MSLLRALFETNLSSIWSSDLASKFRVVLDGVTGTRAAGEVPKASIVELINSLHEAHFRTAELCSTGGGDVGREPMSNAQSTLVDWLLASRQPQQPAMLRPSSMPSNIQQDQKAPTFVPRRIKRSSITNLSIFLHLDGASSTQMRR